MLRLARFSPGLIHDFFFFVSIYSDKARQLWEEREQIELNKMKQLAANQERVRKEVEQKKKVRTVSNKNECQSFVSSLRPWTCILRYWHWTTAGTGESFDVFSRIVTRMSMAAEGCLIALRFHLDAFWGTVPDGCVSRVGCNIGEKHLSNTQSFCPDSTESCSSHRTSSLYLLLENGRLSIQWTVGDCRFHLSIFIFTFVSAAIACITNQISPTLCSP